MSGAWGQPQRGPGNLHYHERRWQQIQSQKFGVHMYTCGVRTSFPLTSLCRSLTLSGPVSSSVPPASQECCIQRGNRYQSPSCKCHAHWLSTWAVGIWAGRGALWQLWLLGIHDNLQLFFYESSCPSGKHYKRQDVHLGKCSPGLAYSVFDYWAEA